MRAVKKEGRSRRRAFALTVAIGWLMGTHVKASERDLSLLSLDELMQVPVVVCDEPAGLDALAALVGLAGPERQPGGCRLLLGR